MKQALKEYPNDALLLVQLSNSIEKQDGNTLQKYEYLKESAAVQEQILHYSKDSQIGSAVLFNICFTYWKLGDSQKAIEQAKKLPNTYKTKENALAYFLEGDTKKENSISALEPLKWALNLHLNVLADFSNNNLFRQKAEEICTEITELQKLI